MLNTWAAMVISIIMELMTYQDTKFISCNSETKQVIKKYIKVYRACSKIVKRIFICFQICTLRNFQTKN